MNTLFDNAPEPLPKPWPSPLPTQTPPYVNTDGRLCAVRPDVINEYDVMRMLPFLQGHLKWARWVVRAIRFDEANRVHGKYCYATGAEFSHLLAEEFEFKLRIDNEEVLDRFLEGPFITVSNHPYGGIDGILLIHILSKRRPEFRVMVNLFLDQIQAMRPSFIAVDPLKDDHDMEKKRITLQGLREAMMQIRDGKPLGFFPAGAVSKFHKNGKIEDREWQENVIRLIKQLDVPVIPVYFHGRNSIFFNLLGVIDWRLRSLYLPRELFKMRGKEIHISIGEPIMPQAIAGTPDVETLGRMLRDATYALKHTSARS